jgi:subtilisin-like proprotein convertase family protein
MRQNAILVGLGLVTAAVGMNGPLAEAATFTNPTPITINDNANASLYPSNVVVGASFPIVSIGVTLNQFSHPRFSDLTVLLVSPSGKAVQLMANAPGALLSPLSMNFSDAGRPLNGDSFLKVPYRPTVIPGPVLMPAPAPGLPYLTSFESLIGDDAAGTWSLYVRDNVSGQVGAIADGWSLFINTPINLANVTSEFAYQGVLRSDGTPISGTFDVRADLWRSPTSVLPADKLTSSTSFGVSIENGLFTTRFAPPGSPFSGSALWVEIAVKGAGDADFVTLEGRTPLTATPYASYALMSEVAEFAERAGSASFSNLTGVPPNVANAFSPWLSQAGNAISYSLGNVLIGTTTGTSKLTVNGTIESTSGGIKFPDDTVQTTAAVSPVVASGTATIDFASMAAGTESSAGIGIVTGGLLLTDAVAISPQTDLPADFSIEYARVNSATQIRFRIRNNGTVTVDPPPTIFNYKVIR